MRLAIITPWYPYEKQPLFGIFVHNQAKALSAHCDVDVLLLQRNIITKVETTQDGRLTIYRKKCLYLPNKSRSLLDLWAKRYYQLFEKLHKLNKYDLIHCHDHYGAYAAHYINQKINVPYVVTIHNSSILNGNLPQWKMNYLPQILDGSKLIISVGQALARALHKYTQRSIEVIPNFIDTDRFSPDDNDLPTSPFKLLFVGDLNDNKGAIRLIKAIAELQEHDVNVTIIGEGPLEREINQFIEYHRLTSKIEIRGQVSNLELPAIYNNHHAYVSLSQKETFGITIIEAMSCGLPVIYTASGGPEHNVSAHGCYLTEADSIDVIKKTIISLQSEYKEIDRARIRQHVLDKFSTLVTLKKLLSIYKSIIQDG